jgi:DNA invertase Pin-like site-specific DNA recombinase
VNVAIYTRTAADMPVTGQQQRDACVRLAKGQGWVVSEVYSDPALPWVHGDRSDFGRLLADVVAGRVEAIVVYDLDLISRTAVSLRAFLDVADRRGIRVVTVDATSRVEPRV